MKARRRYTMIQVLRQEIHNNTSAKIRSRNGLTADFQCVQQRQETDGDEDL